MAKGPAATPIFGDAYLADTTHLSTEEHGAYFLMMLAAWRSPDCTLPNDDKKLANIARVSLKRWRAMADTLREFWTIEGDRLFQKRLRREHEWVSAKARVNRNSAEARWKGQDIEKTRLDACERICGRTCQNLCGSDAPPPPPKKEEEEETQSTAALHDSRETVVVDLIDFLNQCAQAGAVSVNPSRLSVWNRELDIVKGWRDAGVPDDLALKVIERRTADTPDQTVASLRFFDAAVLKAHAVAKGKGNGFAVNAADWPEERRADYLAAMDDTERMAAYRTKWAK